MGHFSPSPHGRIKDLPGYSYDDVDYGTMLDVARGRRFQVAAKYFPMEMVRPWTDANGNPVNPGPIKLQRLRPIDYSAPVASEQMQQPLRGRPDYGEIEMEIEKRMGQIASMIASSFFTNEEMSLPKGAHQSVNTPTELFKQAEEADIQMRVWLEEISKKLALRHYHQIKYGCPQIDFDDEGAILITTPVKSFERSEEKVKGEYGGDWSMLIDMVRATIAVDTIGQVAEVLDVLRKSGMKLARRPKDKFEAPDKYGFRNVHLNMVLPNGHIGEIQVHVKSVLKVREDMHKFYEVAREIEADAEKAGKDMTREENIITSEIQKLVTKRYSEAWEKAGGGKVAAEKEGKAKVFLPPKKVSNPDNLVSVFLAGSIDMGEAEDWQTEISKALKDTLCVVMNPRRDDWDSSWKQEITNDKFREQVEWELEGMEKSTLIAMCLTKDSKAPISLLELGLHASEGKMIVCCPKGFWRKGNVDIVCKKYGVKVFEDFDEFKAEVVKRMQKPVVSKKSASDRLGWRILARRFIAGMLSVNTKREATMNVKEGDICTVNMGVIRSESSSKDFGTGNWVKVVRDTVKYGDGQVKVDEIRGDSAMVSAVGGGAILGPVQVPIRALKVASVMDKILAMDDNTLVPRDVVAQICGSCAEKMDRQKMTALRASVIKAAYNDFQAKDSVKAAMKDFRGTSEVPQLELTKIPNKTTGLSARLSKLAKSVAAMPVRDDIGIVMKMLKEEGLDAKIVNENSNGYYLEFLNGHDAWEALHLLKDDSYEPQPSGSHRLYLSKI